MLAAGWPLVLLYAECDVTVSSLGDVVVAASTALDAASAVVLVGIVVWLDTTVLNALDPMPVAVLCGEICLSLLPCTGDACAAVLESATVVLPECVCACGASLEYAGVIWLEAILWWL